MSGFDFANRLHEYCKRANLSQAQLGRRTGVSGKTVYKRENGLHCEIDIYPDRTDKAIMEIELSSED